MAYVTKATTSGGRNGRAVLEGGVLGLAMGFPKELGGAGDGHNPEQLFALGWSSCYCQALMLIAKKHGIDAQAAKVTCEVTLNTEGGFNLAAELNGPQRPRSAVHTRSKCTWSLPVPDKSRGAVPTSPSTPAILPSTLRMCSA